MCHSFSRGSAIFEVLGLHRTDLGAAIFRLDEHINRLFRSAKILGMEMPLSHDDLFAAALQTVKTNRLERGFIKIVCYYPQVAFEISPPQNPLDVSIFVLDPLQDLEHQQLLGKEGTTLCLSKWRKLDPQTVPIEAKVAANYLNGMVARMEAEKRGFENGLMLDTQGFIAEGGTHSVFVIKNHCLMTPSLGTVLESITRKTLLEVAEYLKIETWEGRIRPQLLYEADEMFISGTPAKVLPVHRFEDRFLERTPGPLTRKLSDLVDEIVAGRIERFRHWLFPVG
ncbi:MAG: aminotransferase class IV [Thermodesulfobacteriota bacterium]